MGKMINTVAGKISVDDMGKTLMHEHLVFGYDGYEADCAGALSREEVVDRTIKIAKKIMSYGVKTVLDATAMDCGRDVELLREVSEKTGLNIICSTGYYNQSTGSSRYWWNLSLTGDEVKHREELLMTELTKGAAGTNILPGVIKVATSEGVITDYEQKWLEVAGRVQKATGAVIYTHTQTGTMGEEQVHILIENGANPEKIVVGHMCGNQDTGYHDRILAKGVSVGFDRLGQDYLGYPTDEERLKIMKHDVEAGYLNRIVISHDVLGTMWGAPWNLSEATEDVQKAFRNFYQWYIMDKFIPRMIEKEGYTEEQVNQMFIENPKRIFGA